MTPIPQREWDKTGREMNQYWLESRRRKNNYIAPVEKPATPKQPQPDKNRGPPECDGCPVRGECKLVLKLWHQKAPRPQLARAWAGHIAKNRAAMPCLRDESTDDHRFSLRDGK